MWTAHSLPRTTPCRPAVQPFDGAPGILLEVDTRFEPFAAAQDVEVGAVAEGLTHRYTAVGRVSFTIDGRDHALVAYPASGGLRVQCRDATTGVTTHPSSRAPDIDAPDETGHVVLDFNRAVNLPCAFADFATCPLDPAHNTLDVAIEAGEQNPRYS